MWQSHWVWFPFSFFFLFFVVAVGIRLLFFRRFWGGCGWGRGYGFESHEEVLRRRLAAGEITEEEYQRLRDILRR